ncbi:MAG: RNA polymerase sigma factor, partial [Rubripirellula sp.]
MNHSARDNEPSTSHSLLHSVQQGDAEGWRQIAQIYGPIIYGWARRCGCQSADAADVMQETLTSMAEALPRFQHQPDATFRGWLWVITRNKLRDQARRDRDVPEGGTEANMRLNQTADPTWEAGIADEPPSDLKSDES